MDTHFVGINQKQLNC